MIKMNVKNVLCALFASLLISGCDVGSPDVEVAAKVADNFYQALLEKEYERAITAYSSKRDRVYWRSHLEHVTASLGELQAYKLQHTEVNTGQSGRFYIFDYQTTYSSGKQAVETLTIFNRVDEEETSIVSHAIEAEGYTPLM